MTAFNPCSCHHAPPPSDAPLRLRDKLPAAVALIAALASSIVLTLAGCASSAGIATTAQPLSTEQLGLAGAPPAPPVAADWWTGFGDPQLAALVERALAGNPGLKVAQTRLARAEASAQSVEAAQGPQVNGTLDLTRQRFTGNGLYPPPLAGSMRSIGTLQVAGAWEFDFFGRNRSALEAALGAERAAAADVQAARVLLASQLVRGWWQLARLTEQRELAQRALAQREEMLALIRQRVGAGLDTTVELRQGEGALPEARQQIEAIDEQIVLARHALAALSGQPPEALAGLAPRLQQARPMPLPSTLPADLLGRRADIEAARWRVEAAGRDMASARAQFYPNINLTAFIGLSSIGLDRLVNAGSEQYGIGPALRLPIFDAGRLRANLRGKASDVDAAVENYNAAVLEALRDVADQMASLRSIERQQVEQAQAQTAAESAYDLARQRYRAGLGTFLTVLNAESAVLSQRRLGTDLRARALDSETALVRALGGGYAGNPQALLSTHSMTGASL